MKDSEIEWIGQIPENWNIVRVKQAFIRKNEKAQQENPVVLSLARAGVKLRDMSTNEGQVAESYYNYNPVAVGDLLLNPMDLYSGANCSLSEVEGVVSPAYVNLRNKVGYYSKFYDYYFKVQYWMMVFFAHGKGVSFDNRWTLNHETLMNFPIVAPDYETQKRIADFLDDKCGKIDRYIEKQQKIIEKLKAYKQSVITEYVMKDNQKTISLRHCIINIEQGWSPPAADRVDEQLGWSVLSLSAVKHGKFNNDAKKPIDINADIPYILELHNNDFLMTRSNTRELVGDICIVENCSPHMIFSDLIYRISFKNEISIKYMRYVMLSSYVRQQIQKMAKGSSGTMPKISHKSIKEIRVQLLDKEQQCEIAERLDEICDKIDHVIIRREAIIEKLNQYKKSLIYEAVTGKLEV